MAHLLARADNYGEGSAVAGVVKNIPTGLLRLEAQPLPDVVDLEKAMESALSSMKFRSKRQRVVWSENYFRKETKVFS